MLGNRDEAHSAVLPTALEQEYWSLGIVSFDSQEYEVAAMHFRRLGARSRPLYNVALCYFLMDDKESAMVTFEKCLRCDPYFCVGHFQLAFLLQKLGQSERAILHYNNGIQSMRGNGSIDYQQLGLNVVVYACEMFYNMAAAQMDLLDQGAALKSLVNAHQFRCLTRHDVVDHAMISTSDSRWHLFEPPGHEIFRPKSQRRTASLGSLKAFQDGSLPSSRALVNVAAGEADASTQFMAPIHDEIVQEQVEKVDSLRHGRRHSVALSEHRITVDDPPSQLGMAKIHLIDQQHEDEVITQSRLICLENEESLYHLMERIKTKFGLDKVKLKYRDQDGDLITMCEDSDLQAALEAGLLVRGSIKVVLWCLPRG